MSDLRRYRVKHGLEEIEAVQYDGSSTQAHAIERWIEEGEYVAPTVNTQDIRDMVINTPDGEEHVGVGGWVVRGSDGTFWNTPEALDLMYDECTDERSNLVTHALTELDRTGLLGSDSDYDGMIGAAVMELVKVFARQGHSGMSAQITASLFNELASYRALTPLTDDPAEWNKVHDDPVMWQNVRNSEAFSDDGGATFYLVGENPKVIYVSAHADTDTDAGEA